ncbi:MAG: ABC transporter permease [Armatimonadota bacterium]
MAQQYRPGKVVFSGEAGKNLSAPEMSPCMHWYLPDRYPLFWHEARRRLFQLRKPTRWKGLVTAVRIIVGLGLLSLIYVVVPYAFARSQDYNVLFVVYLELQWLPLALITPGLSSWVITEERNKGTFDSLLALPLSSRTLVLQKFAYIAGVALFVFLLFLPCSLPTLFTSPGEWGVGYGLMCSGIACFLAGGLLMGCLFKAAWIASPASYVLAYTIIFILVGIAELRGYTNPEGPIPYPYLILIIGIFVLLTILFLWLASRAVDRLRGG